MPRGVRAFAAFAIVALLTVPLASLVDTLHHEHAICADHGELVHLRADTPLSNGSSRGDDPCGGNGGHGRGCDAATVVLADAGHATAAPHEHEHCPFAGAARKRDDIRPASHAQPIVAAAAPLLSPADETPRPSSLSLYALAPKTSPPIV